MPDHQARPPCQEARCSTAPFLSELSLAWVTGAAAGGGHPDERQAARAHRQGCHGCRRAPCCRDASLWQRPFMTRQTARPFPGASTLSNAHMQGSEGCCDSPQCWSCYAAIMLTAPLMACASHLTLISIDCGVTPLAQLADAPNALSGCRVPAQQVQEAYGGCCLWGWAPESRWAAPSGRGLPDLLRRAEGGAGHTCLTSAELEGLSSC